MLSLLLVKDGEAFSETELSRFLQDAEYYGLPFVAIEDETAIEEGATDE